jgi:hypothetical protein
MGILGFLETSLDGMVCVSFEYLFHLSRCQIRVFPLEESHGLRLELIDSLVDVVELGTNLLLLLVYHLANVEDPRFQRALSLNRGGGGG